MADVITNKEKYKKGWVGGLPETECGSGSTLKNTEQQRIWIPEIIDRYDIVSIADIGAGDLNWLSKMKMPACVEYQGYDLVPRHPDVLEFDLVKETPPKVDMIMCLWVLNHFPYDECRQALKNIINSGSRFLMMTDRLRYREDQPPEIDMPHIEQMILNEKNDSIKLIDLWSL